MIRKYQNVSTRRKAIGPGKARLTLHEVKGKVKEEAGKAIGDPDLQDRGVAEKIAGKVQNKVGDVKYVFGK
jgi:uncharacterized protein YjbJ (UPF0337 family)